MGDTITNRQTVARAHRQGRASLGREVRERAIRWIAENDEPTVTDPYSIAEQLTVVMVAEVLEMPTIAVAKLVLHERAGGVS